jgi:ribonuclease T1
MRLRGLLAAVLLLVLTACGQGGTATADTVALSSLPPEAAATARLIEDGGPFPYARDGAVFRNAERQLPEHPRGWYHEYTVPTPGSSDRGARRIVRGRDGALYYTQDHYRSFKRIEESGE